MIEQEPDINFYGKMKAQLTIEINSRHREDLSKMENLIREDWNILEIETTNKAVKNMRIKLEREL